MAPQNSTFICENPDASTDLSRFNTISPVKKDPKTEEGKHSSEQQKSIQPAHATNVQTLKLDELISVSEHENVDGYEYTLETETEEIPIWICGEPRFISGITNTTTCNDIIRALIDDEIHNGDNLNTRNFNTDVAVSRDFQDYVITERWRDIEQALDGNTCILPIWLAWGAAQNEVKFKLKINKKITALENTISQHENKKKDHKIEKVNLVKKMLRRIIKQGEIIQDHLSVLSGNTFLKTHRTTKNIEKLSKHSKTLLLKKFLNDTKEHHANFLNPEPDEEHFFVIENKNPQHDISNLSEKLQQNSLDEKLGKHFKKNNCRTLSNRYYGYSCVNLAETPKRKRRTKRELNSLRNHSLNRELYRSTSILQVNSPFRLAKNNSIKNATELNRSFPSPEVLRSEIMVITDEISKLLDHEELLIRNLEKKCEKYRSENEIYTRKRGLEVCIDKVQHNLRKYASEIAQNEVDLYRIKTEIRRKYAVLGSLKRMLDSDDKFEKLKKSVIEHHAKINNNSNSIPFVDNIHEFCDNNESLIV